MHAAQGNGKTHFEFYQAHLLELLFIRLSSEEALCLAIKDEQIVVFYQPRVEAQTRQLCSTGALMRWQHP